MSVLTYEQFDVLEDRREQIVYKLVEGPVRFTDLATHSGVSKATLEYHLAKLMEQGIIEERTEGRGTYYGLTKAWRELHRTSPRRFNDLLKNHNGRRKKRLNLTSAKIPILSILFVAVLMLGLFLGSSSQPPLGTSAQTTMIGSESLPLDCLNHICPDRASTYPIVMFFEMTNDFGMPTAALGNVTPAYPNVGQVLSPRTLLVFDASSHGNDTVAYTAIKVYDSDNHVIGQLVWNPLTMSSGPTCIGESSGYSNCLYGFTIYPSGSNPIPIILNRPIQYDEKITVVAYYGNEIYGVWSGIVH